MSLAANPLNPALRKNPATLHPTLPAGQQSAAESAIASLGQADPADALADVPLRLPFLPAYLLVCLPAWLLTGFLYR